ncbi:MAG TPA: hypothetical protein PKM65_20495 [Spirochaetota bacterium]|nr:hypothetical protein [Spirochaetota bacterium]
MDYIPNEPAFPRTMWTGSDKNNAHRDVAGMSLRDYFAAKAMQGALSAAIPVNGHIEIDGNEYAKAAYALADSMLKARLSSIGQGVKDGK